MLLRLSPQRNCAMWQSLDQATCNHLNPHKHPSGFSQLHQLVGRMSTSLLDRATMLFHFHLDNVNKNNRILCRCVRASTAPRLPRVTLATTRPAECEWLPLAWNLDQLCCKPAWTLFSRCGLNVWILTDRQWRARAGATPHTLCPILRLPGAAPAIAVLLPVVRCAPRSIHKISEAARRCAPMRC